LAFTDCQKQPETSTPEEQDPQVVSQFEKADKKIGTFMDQLESANTPLGTRKQIICTD